MAHVQKISPNLWFDSEAEQAIQFYTSIFPNSSIGRVARYGKEGVAVHGRQPGSVMTIEFQIAGQTFLALNGGPIFKFNEAISFVVNCDNQKEVDHYWSLLGEGGDPNAQICGWLKDKFGLSWQIVPSSLADLMTRGNGEKVMAALLKMKKLDVAVLEEAAKG